MRLRGTGRRRMRSGFCCRIFFFLYYLLFFFFAFLRIERRRYGFVKDDDEAAAGDGEGGEEREKLDDCGDSIGGKLAAEKFCHDGFPSGQLSESQAKPARIAPIKMISLTASVRLSVSVKSSSLRFVLSHPFFFLSFRHGFIILSQDMFRKR